MLPLLPLLSWPAALGSLLCSASAALLPSACLGCGEVPLKSGRQALCGPCRRSLMRWPPACGGCLTPVVGAALFQLCPLCRALGPPAALLPRLAVYQLTGPLALAVRAAKYRGHMRAWDGLAGLAWQDARVRACLAATDACAFVPSDVARLRRRGYEHAGLFAAAIARRARRPLLPMLRKVRVTVPQSSLDRHRRHGNLIGAFSSSAWARGRRIVLLDDVTTTGATLEAGRQALLAAEAASVVAICLAAPPPLR